MHRCLRIEEIVRTIASSHRGPTHAPLLSLALACRSFYEPAMDALWRSLTQDIEPLLLLLPANVLERDEIMGINITGTPRDDEWDRFRHHAKRVRFLSIYDEEPFRVNSEALEKLCQIYPGPYPLPNLRAIKCDDGACLYDEWSKLLPPTLVEASMIQFDEYNAMAFLDTFTERPQLKRLYYDERELWSVDQAYVRSHLNWVVTHLQNLTAVRVGPLFTTTIQHLASLPALEMAGIELDTSTDYRILLSQSEIGCVPFPALKTLHLTAPAATCKSLCTFLDVIHRSRLERIDITFGLSDEKLNGPQETTLVSTQPRYINTVTEALAQFSTLRRVSFWASGEHYQSPALVFDTQTIEPLFRLTLLTSLSMAKHPVYLDSALFRRIIAAWPDIQVLKLGHNCPLEVPHLNAEDLLPLSTGCPKLETLGVRIGGDIDVSTLAKRPCAGQSTSKLQVLAVGNSEIKNSAHLAAFVSGAFPAARVSENAWRCIGRETRPELAQVNTLLPLFAKAEKLERSNAFGPLRPHYGEAMQCPHSSWTVRDLIMGEVEV